MLLETTDTVTVSESSARGISVLQSNFVIKPLSMSHVTEVREALLAKQLFDDDGLENANASVVCTHISLLDVTNFLHNKI